MMLMSISSPPLRMRPEAASSRRRRIPIITGGNRRLRTRILIRKSTLASGTVKWFNAQKGFGFIQPSDGGKDVFVHISAVERAGLSSLNEGQSINYDVVNERGKDAAANLKVA